MTDREWREASDMRPSATGLAWVLGVAAACCASGRSATASPSLSASTNRKSWSRVLTMMKTGSFNPHFFDYPGLTFYMQLPVAIVRFLLGAIGGRFRASIRPTPPTSTCGRAPSPRYSAWRRCS